MSHGVHRGVLKKGKIDNREIFLKKVINLAKDNIKCDLWFAINNQYGDKNL